MSFINKAIRSIKAKTFSDVENMVRDATNNDQWGPTTKQMGQIAKACRDSVEYMKIFAMIWKRVNDTDHPTHVTKVSARAGPDWVPEAWWRVVHVHSSPGVSCMCTVLFYRTFLPLGHPSLSKTEVSHFSRVTLIAMASFAVQQNESMSKNMCSLWS